MSRLAFDDFEIDLALFQLRRCGEPVSIGAKPLDLLIFLIENRDRVVSREQLRSEIWDGADLSTATIPTAIMAVRRALGDSGETPCYVTSERTRGYRFMGSIRRIDADDSRRAPSQSLRPLVGRHSEISELRRNARHIAKEKSGRVVAITGEAGMGKSRLLSEFRNESESEFETFSTWAASIDGAPALWPWIQLVKSMCNRPNNRSQRFSDLISNLGEVIPELAEFSPTKSPTEGLRPHGNSFQLWTETITAAVDDKPVMILVDDVHRLDRDSMLLLYWLADEIARKQIMLVVTSRPGLGSDESFAILGEIGALPHASDIDLSPLRESDVRELLDPLHPDFDILPSTLISRTGGNAFYLTHLLRHLDKIPDLDLESSNFVGIPLHAREIVTQQLAGLPPETKTALSAASVLGDQFDPISLAKMLEPSTRQITESLGPALDASILVREPETYAFNHSLLRESLYRTISGSLRQKLHLRAAGQLISSSRATRASAEISHHLVQALPLAEPTLALDYSLSAARDASIKHAHSEARKLLLRCLDLVERVDANSTPDRATILIELAEAALYCGDREDARKRLLEAARLARSSENWPLLATCALHIAPDFLSIEVGACDPILIQLLSESIQNTDHADLPLQASLYARLSQAKQWTDDSADRVDLADHALRIATESRSQAALLAALAAKAETLNGPRFAPERLVVARRLGDVARKAGDLPELFLHHTRAISAHLEMGDLEAVDRENQLHKNLAEETQLRQYHWLSIATESMLHVAHGEIDQGEQKAELYLDIAGGARDANVQMTYAGQALLRQYERGDLHSLVPGLREIAEKQKSVRFWQAIYAWVLQNSGHHEEASRILGRFNDYEIGRLLMEPGGGLGIANLAIVASDLGSSAQQRKILAITAPLSRRCATAGYGVAYFGSFARYSGLLHRALGDAAAAEAAFAAALGDEEARGLPSWSMYSVADLLITAADNARDLTPITEKARRMLEADSAKHLPRARQTLERALAISSGEAPRPDDNATAA